MNVETYNSRLLCFFNFLERFLPPTPITESSSELSDDRTDSSEALSELIVGAFPYIEAELVGLIATPALLPPPIPLRPSKTFLKNETIIRTDSAHRIEYFLLHYCFKYSLLAILWGSYYKIISIN